MDGADVLLSDLISGDYVAVDWDEDGVFMETAPQIQVNGNDFFYVNFEDSTFWFDNNAGGPDEGTPIETGVGMWFTENSCDSCTLQFKGKVVSDSSKPVDVIGGEWNLICNPFPVEFTLFNVNFEGLVAVEWDEDGAFMETASQIQANGCDYFYVSFEDSEFWFDNNAGGPYEGDPIPVGCGFWFKAATDVTATFSL